MAKKFLALVALLYGLTLYAHSQQAGNMENKPSASSSTVVAAPIPGALDQTVADFFLTCASARTTNLLVLKSAGQDVEHLYIDIGFSHGAGQAYSSKDYADRKFQELREADKARATQAVAVSQDALAASGAAFMSSLYAQLSECASYQHEHKDEIIQRMRHAGVFKK